MIISLTYIEANAFLIYIYIFGRTEMVSKMPICTEGESQPYLYLWSLYHAPGPGFNPLHTLFSPHSSLAEWLVLASFFK